MLTLLALASLLAADDDSSCAHHLCGAGALAAVFQRLEATRGQASARPVHILQIGDSHTAGDAITGAWRRLLQARYGSGGRGVLPVGRPFVGYRPADVTVTVTRGWTTDALFGPARRAVGAPVGAAGFSATGSAGASASLSAAPEASFDAFDVCAISRSGSARLSLEAGASRKELVLDDAGPSCTTLATSTQATTARVTVEQGPVTLTSWETRRTFGGGVVLSNLGVVGSQAVHFARADEQVLQLEMSRWRPDLVVVEYGTNEAFAGDLRLDATEAAYRALLARLKRVAPEAALLVVGAPDAVTSRPDLIARSGSLAASCAAAPPLRPPIDVEADPSAARAPPSPARAGTRYTPARLEAIRALQRRVAREAGAAFWDWSASLGGRCAAAYEMQAEPPLRRADGVHFTTEGARRTAERLDADIAAALADLT